MRTVAVYFIEAAEQERLAMQADNVFRGQDAEHAALVLADDLLLQHGDPAREVRIGGNQLLDKREIVGGLPLVVCDDEAVIASGARPREEAIERRKAKI